MGQESAIEEIIAVALFIGLIGLRFCASRVAQTLMKGGPEMAKKMKPVKKGAKKPKKV